MHKKFLRTVAIILAFAWISQLIGVSGQTRPPLQREDGTLPPGVSEGCFFACQTFGSGKCCDGVADSEQATFCGIPSGTYCTEHESFGSHYLCCP